MSLRPATQVCSIAGPSDRGSAETVEKSWTSQDIETILVVQTDQVLMPLLERSLWHSLKSLQDLLDCSFHLIAFSCDSLSCVSEFFLEDSLQAVQQLLASHSVVSLFVVHCLHVLTPLIEGFLFKIPSNRFTVALPYELRT